LIFHETGKSTGDPYLGEDAEIYFDNKAVVHITVREKKRSPGYSQLQAIHFISTAH
jgi:hypothetical protein